MDPITLGLLAGGSLLSGIGGMTSSRRARRAAARAQRRALNLVEGQRPMLQRGYADYLRALTEGEAAINRGAQGAKQAFAQQGTAALTQVKEGESKTLGDIKQHLLNTGTYSTSVMQNAQRGISAQATRQIAAVREMVARLAGGVEQTRGAQLAGVSQARAQGAMQRYGAEADINTQLANILANTQYSAGNDMGGWGQLLAGLAPFLGGVPSGVNPAQYRGYVSYQYQH